MHWLTLSRVPETEVMSDTPEVEAYASAAAQAYLDSLDNTLVEHAISLGAQSGLLLDVGTGPGRIPLKLARLCPALRVVGIDRSAAMIRAARESARKENLSERTQFFRVDAHELCFRSGVFDWILSNSLLHHLRDPAAAFNEMARVARPNGVILVRDLRRPSRLLFPLHVRWYGRYYSGLMRKLYKDSVRAAYTGGELAELLRRSSLVDARVFFHERTHLGFIRGERDPEHVKW